MTFAFGDKCFAKVKGFPHWPARINNLPEGVKIPKGKYPIFFYGTHEVCFLSPNAIFSYEKFKSKYGVARNTVGFNVGLEEMETNSTIYQFGIDPKADKFLSQFYTFPVSKKKHKPEIAPDKQETCNPENSETDKNISSCQMNIDDQMVRDVQVKIELSIPTELLMTSSMEPEAEFKDPNEFLKQEHSEHSEQIQQNIQNNNFCLPVKKKQNGKKCNTDEYSNDFTNLLLEIRKYSWSKARIYDIKRLMKKNKTDSRIRIFFPWYQALTRK